MSNSTTTNKASKAAVLAKLQALVTGLQKQLPSGSFTLVSTAYTTATLVTAIQALITALSAVDTAQANAKAALVAYETEDTKMSPIIQALTRVIQSMYANAPDTLALFGLKPRKAPAPRTAAEKAASAVKAKATRAARGTTSKKQKALVTGNVTGINIIPVIAPTPQPAPQVTAPPAATQPTGAAPAATQPATPAVPVSPSGHAGQ